MEIIDKTKTELLDESGIKKLRIIESQGAPDVIECDGKAYVAVDLEAIEDLVKDLTALKDFPEPVVTGPSAHLMAERIKKAVGKWQG